MSETEFDFLGPEQDEISFSQIEDSGSYDLKPWAPAKFKPQHEQMILLYALGLMKPGELAEKFGMSFSRVSIILNDPRAEEMIARFKADSIRDLQAETKEVIQSAAKEAAQTVVGLMRNAQSERIRQTSAFDILDRAGFQAKDVQIRVTGTIEKDAAEVLREAMRESMQELEPLEMVQDSAGIFHPKEED